MTDPDKQVVEMISTILKEYQEQGEDLPLICGFISPDGGEYFSYLNCNYCDLRKLATAIQDEATLLMISRNQDRLQRFIEEAGATSDDSE